MSHYYTPDADLPHQPGQAALELEGKSLVFNTDAGVFSRGNVDFGSRLLIETLLTRQPSLGGRVLDLGCGYGPIGLSLAALRSGVCPVLVDVNRRALELARENARQMGIDAVIVDSDGFAAVTGTFDHIVTNPPIRAGKSVYYPWFEQAPLYLCQGGSFWCVVQKKQGAASVQAALDASFGQCSRVARDSGYQIFQAVRR